MREYKEEKVNKMEDNGFEPMALPVQKAYSTNWANPPYEREIRTPTVSGQRGISYLLDDFVRQK